MLDILVHLRDRHGVKLTVDSIRERLAGPAFPSLATEVRFRDAPRQARKRVQYTMETMSALEGLPDRITEEYEYMAALVSDALASIETETKWRKVRSKPLQEPVMQVFHGNMLVAGADFPELNT
jgi:hypothetical protein